MKWVKMEVFYKIRYLFIGFLIKSYKGENIKVYKGIYYVKTCFKFIDHYPELPEIRAPKNFKY